MTDYLKIAEMRRAALKGGTKSELVADVKIVVETIRRLEDDVKFWREVAVDMNREIESRDR